MLADQVAEGFGWDGRVGDDGKAQHVLRNELSVDAAPLPVADCIQVKSLP